jgi:hypothetical protein
VEVVVVVVAGVGEVAALEVEAWTRRRLSLLVEGPLGRGGLVLVSATGAREGNGLEFAAGAGALVCAVAAVRPKKQPAPAQRKI